MNLGYRILWFEDEPASFKAKKRLVKRIVENFGFNFPEPRNEIDGVNIDNLNFKANIKHNNNIMLRVNYDQSK